MPYKNLDKSVPNVAINDLLTDLIYCSMHFVYMLVTYCPLKKTLIFPLPVVLFLNSY